MTADVATELGNGSKWIYQCKNKSKCQKLHDRSSLLLLPLSLLFCCCMFSVADAQLWTRSRACAVVDASAALVVGGFCGGFVFRLLGGSDEEWVHLKCYIKYQTRRHAAASVFFALCFLAWSFWFSSVRIVIAFSAGCFLFFVGLCLYFCGFAWLWFCIKVHAAHQAAV